MADYGTLKILLVEDNQHMRSIVLAILKGSGIRDVREARDGAEAFDILRQFPADIALVDFNMYPIDGVEFTRMLRTASDSVNPYLPVVMITGHSERSRVVEARDAGVNEFVAKPLTARALLSRLDAVVMRPRPYIRCAAYFGPDRRRKIDPAYNGPFRRATDGLLA
ncbi:response regulator [Asticcacaulis sp. AND118]|uniref:response regulator n=1 Tax=Asticcacaulis sp. AND118 TaxID=2840468 RepID=UPI001CFF760D|nr:response regulator [Asticcacaulis sp. AND118]UDF04786.1 response regulator [Asticcacaulis sp. AND118]